MSEFTADDKRRAAEREVAFRRRAYPKWVKDGKMTDGMAASQIAVMEAIAEDYRKLAKRAIDDEVPFT